MTFDENMTFDEFIDQISERMELDTVQGYIQAKDLLGWASTSKKFTEPYQREKMGNISSEIMLYSGDLIVREYPKKEGFQPDDSDFEDEDDLEDDEDDPAVFIQWSPEKGVEYISG
jgi:Uma2 family endonuclease